MYKRVLILVIFLAGCHAYPTLKPGLWSGTLTPMNHPEMKNPITYDISYNDQELSINIVSPDSTVIKTQDPQLANDTLYFSFAEPEEQVVLRCKLSREANQGFKGKCTDKRGKWALFTMKEVN